MKIRHCIDSNTLRERERVEVKTEQRDEWLRRRMEEQKVEGEKHRVEFLQVWSLADYIHYYLSLIPFSIHLSSSSSPSLFNASKQLETCYRRLRNNFTHFIPTGSYSISKSRSSQNICTERREKWVWEWKGNKWVNVHWWRESWDRIKKVFNCTWKCYWELYASNWSFTTRRRGKSYFPL